MEQFVTDLLISDQQLVRAPEPRRAKKSLSPALYRSLALAARNRAKEEEASKRQIYLIIATELDRLRKTWRKKHLPVWRRCGTRRNPTATRL